MQGQKLPRWNWKRRLTRNEQRERVSVPCTIEMRNQKLQTGQETSSGLEVISVWPQSRKPTVFHGTHCPRGICLFLHHCVTSSRAVAWHSSIHLGLPFTRRPLEPSKLYEVFQGISYHNDTPQIRQLKTTDIYFLTVLKAGVLQSWHDWGLWGRNCSRLPPSFGWLTRNLIGVLLQSLPRKSVHRRCSPCLFF